MRSRRVLEPGISDRPSRRYSARPTTNDFIAESTEVDGLRSSPSWEHTNATIAVRFMLAVQVR